MPALRPRTHAHRRRAAPHLHGHRAPRHSSATLTDDALAHRHGVGKPASPARAAAVALRLHEHSRRLWPPSSRTSDRQRALDRPPTNPFRLLPLPSTVLARRRRQTRPR
jgi:hypothetical protein